MKHETSIDAREPRADYAPCRYGASRLLFRGPRRPLDGRHLAFAGGSETFGRHLDAPFPALVEEVLGQPCVNLGQVNGSVDVLAGDPVIVEACRDARISVVEVTGALNLSNRFYSVHPRRNDRFLRASSVLSAVFPEVDLSDVCFTRHLLARLHERAPDRIPILRQELQTAWSARMRGFLSAIGPRTVLLWLSPNLPSDRPWEEREDPLGLDPLFVTRRMVDALRPLVRGVVMAHPSRQARGPGGLSAAAHREAAAALVGALRGAMT